MNQFKFVFVALLLLISNSVFGQDTIQERINYFVSQAKLDSAKTYINANLELVSKEKKTALNYELVKVYFMQSAYDDALQQAFNSLDSIDDEEERIKFNFMLGVIYSAISDYDKSIEYYDLVVKHSQDPSLTVKAHVLLSDLYLGKKDSTNAGKSLTEAYKITSQSKEESPIKDHVTMQYNFYTENYELCKEQNLKVIKDSTSFLNTKSYAYSMIGDCLVKQDSLLEATKYFDEFLKLTVETNDPEQVKVAAQKLIDVYEKIGDQEKANAFHKIYNEAVNDSLSFSVEKYRELYNVERVRELKIAKSKNQKRNFIFGAILALLISFGAYYFFKLKNKKRAPGKKIVISDIEIQKIEKAIEELKVKQSYLIPNITRKSFCSESGIKSERYLSQYINEKYKKSFSVFINDLRIEHAYNRIQNDSKFRNYKIEEIAKECGFGSKKSFERAFVAKYGETPYKLIISLIS